MFKFWLRPCSVMSILNWLTVHIRIIICTRICTNNTRIKTKKLKVEAIMKLACYICHWHVIEVERTRSSRATRLLPQHKPATTNNQLIFMLQLLTVEDDTLSNMATCMRHLPSVLTQLQGIRVHRHSYSYLTNNSRKLFAVARAYIYIYNWSCNYMCQKLYQQ